MIDQDDGVDKNKIKLLLDSLENNIRENHKLHEQEIMNMALTFNQGEKSDRFRSEDGESFSGEKLSLEDNEAVGYHT